MEGAARVDFQELSDPQSLAIWNGRHVQIYGFLHRVPDGAAEGGTERKWILSTRAKLQSCCLAQPDVQKGSIWLEGDLTEQALNADVSRPTLLEGSLIWQKVPHKEPVWMLAAPHVIRSQETNHFLATPFGLIGAGICGLLMLYFMFTYVLKRLSR